MCHQTTGLNTLEREDRVSDVIATTPLNVTRHEVTSIIMPTVHINPAPETAFIRNIYEQNANYNFIDTSFNEDNGIDAKDG